MGMGTGTGTGTNAGSGAGSGMQPAVGVSAAPVTKVGSKSRMQVPTAPFSSAGSVTEQPVLGAGSGAGAGAGGSGASAGPSKSTAASTSLAAAQAKFGELVAKLNGPTGTSSVDAIPSTDGFQFMKFAIGCPTALLAARNSPVSGSRAQVLWKCVMFAFSVASNFQPETPLGMLGRLAMFYIRYFKTADSKLFSATHLFNEVTAAEVAEALATASAKNDANLVEALNMLNTIVKVQEQFSGSKILWMPANKIDHRTNSFQAGLVAALVLANGPAGEIASVCQTYLKENSGATKAHTPQVPVSDALVAALEMCKAESTPSSDAVKAFITQVVTIAASSVRRRKNTSTDRPNKVQRVKVSQETPGGDARPGAGGRPDYAEIQAGSELGEFEDDPFA